MPKNHDMSGDAPATSKDVPSWVAQFLAVSQQQNEQVQQREQHVQQQMQQLLAALVEQKLEPEQSLTKQQSPDAYGDLMQDLPHFNYDDDDDSTFDAWYKRLIYPLLSDTSEIIWTGEKFSNVSLIFVYFGCQNSQVSVPQEYQILS
uniref:Uncharacterized protein n=1 Tax=Haemonchus contortus TaxID=6289 RepID=W6NHI0_HAECO